jgi:hypothetical protein
MPLVESTVVKDGDEIVATKERKLYTLAELKALDERPAPEQDDEIDSRAYENALDKMREFQFDNEWWYESTLDNDAVELFKACGITVPQKTEQVYPKVDGKYQHDESGQIVSKWVTRDDTIWDSWDVDRGEFVLNDRAVVDEKAYLRALQWYLAGKDIRDLPALRWGQPTPPRPLTASPRQQRKLDLRSKDARIIREQGLTISRASHWSPKTREFDLDYQYDGLSDQTKEDANDLLRDLCSEVIALLRDEQDYLGSEPALLEMAEANEYRFDRTGRIA